MQDKELKLIDFASVELLAAHYVRIIKWLIAALVIAICLLFSSIAIQYAFSTEVIETEEVVADQRGDGTFLAGGGNVNYGFSEGSNP